MVNGNKFILKKDSPYYYDFDKENNNFIITSKNFIYRVINHSLYGIKIVKKYANK